MFARILSVLFLVGGLAACDTGGATVRTGQVPAVERSYDLQGLNFVASADLSVSENEGYYPMAAVVWRGDPRGARISQIAAMFEEAADRNTRIITGDVPVVVDVRLVRFHGVTDRTRYSVGGVYNIIFELTVRDARNGVVIEPARRIVANLDAPGGTRAVQLEQSGQTQKVRVTDFLTTVLRNALI